MAKIVKIEGPYAILDQEVRDKGQLTKRIKTDNINVTDRNIGLLPGTEIAPGDPGFYVTRLAPQVPLLGGRELEIDSNPYNFVALGATSPWVDKPPETKDPDPPGHPGHWPWREKVQAEPAPADPATLHTGRIRFTLTTRTPVFIPEGEMGAGKKHRDDPPQRFFRMRRSGETVARYAIPGASLKGVLRSEVEAVANSHIGVFNEEFYEKPIPYRRRAYQKAGMIVTSVGKFWLVRGVEIAYLNENEWGGSVPKAPFSYKVEVRQHRDVALPGAGKTATEVRRFRGNLLWTENAIHRYTHIAITPTTESFQLKEDLAVQYRENLEHPQFKRHLDNAPGKLYCPPMPPTLTIWKDLERIAPGELIYFTFEVKATRTGSTFNSITSFGKNINYLWPSPNNIKEMVKGKKMVSGFVREEQEALSLESELDVAERLFGFSAKHQSDPLASYPFRGKVRIETAWGGPVGAEEPDPVGLAPLTAPQTRAKARPLYLEGAPQGRAPSQPLSASYSDNPAPTLMGRKFYWHQRPPANTPHGLWPIHQRGDRHEEKQLGPKIRPLPPGEVFQGCLHFRNLSDVELGALLYVLKGDGPDHCLKIGKGKPRGLGSMRADVSSIEFLDPAYYNSLEGDASPYSAASADDPIAAFKRWCKRQAGSGEEFHQLGHIRDYQRLHKYPSSPALRLYPLNFKDYGWLPADNRNPDEPRSGARPKALRRARYIL